MKFSRKEESIHAKSFKGMTAMILVSSQKDMAFVI